ncbi:MULTISPECIES: hypothetical protein [Streptomyces]|uniref:hypothetical protein n=1 Tax=Streptomyces TaxID=1883 RepID=UPI00081BB40D|nr:MULTISPECIES: hypothetical protein [unclassified Streptomyces]MYQ50504.1 hypothetical protein [Streptomyces sp. SID4941]SCD41670.1 hypothetical protein GA0115247_104231 [Streptomyces sp. PalvLS-984]SDC57309.1 hypothetical protein F558DRAFT_02163 [Streptomyces sp. AmelKG-A3]
MNDRPALRPRLLAVLGAALLLTSCSSAGGGDHRATGGQASHWGKDVGAPEASAFMKVAVPESATEVKGAVQINPQEDIYLLSFLTDEKTAVGVAEDLRPEKPLRTRNQDLPSPTELYGHLGLAEPQNEKSVRWAGVCPPCVGDSRRSEVQWIEIHLLELDAGTTRVYMQAY